MPIFRTNGKVIYFAHVPKSAGTAIEQYLLDRFGTGAVAFLDRHYLSIPPELRWNRTSPQHVARAALDHMFPADFFDASFAVVRHPVNRLASVFLYQRDVQNDIPQDMPFADWVAAIPEYWETQPFHLDNHILPMSQFIPEGATIFQLENGLGPVVDWIDGQAGCRDETVAIQWIYTYSQNMANMQKDPRPVTDITEELYGRICALYADDIARFGYGAAD